jgi:hypothetical protein
MSEFVFSIILSVVIVQWVNTYLQGLGTSLVHFVFLALVSKDIVFRLIIEYNSLMEFGP